MSFATNSAREILRPYQGISWWRGIGLGARMADLDGCGATTAHAAKIAMQMLAWADLEARSWFRQHTNNNDGVGQITVDSEWFRYLKNTTFGVGALVRKAWKRL